MLQAIGILFAVGWLISPIVLLCILAGRNTKKMKLENALRKLYYSGRATLSELIDAGIDPKTVPREGGAIRVQPPVQTGQLPGPQAQQPPMPGASTQMLPPLAGQTAVPSAVAIAAQRTAAERELDKIKQLRADGALSEEEFETLANVQRMRLAALPPVPVSPAPQSVQLPAEAENPAVSVQPGEDSQKPQPVSVPNTESPAAVSEQTEKTETPVHTPSIGGANHSPLRPAVKEAEFVPEQPRELHISAITAMLSVGVVLIVVAGVLLVRSNWSTMSDFSRLLLLGAGSVLFFGTSSLARRLWHLERTGMAFFTLGAAFLPISIWAAGYFNLLGEGLSGADNPWTAALAFAAFTVIAVIALRMYDQLGWAIGALCGGMLSYLYMAGGLFWDNQRAAMLLAAAIPAVVLSYTVDRLQMRLPEQLSRAILPFTVIYTVAASLAMVSGFTLSAKAVCGLAALLCAAAWLSPVLSGLIGNYAAIPTGLEVLLGFALMLNPLLGRAGDTGRIAQVLTQTEYHALIWIASAAVFAVLILVGAVSEDMQRGFTIGGLVLTGGAVLVETFACLTLYDGYQRSSPVLVIPALLLSALLCTVTVRRDAFGYRPASAAQTWAAAFCSSALLLSGNHISGCRGFLLCGALMLGAFALFRFVRGLHTETADVIFSASAALCGIAAVAHRALPVWHIVLGYSLCALSMAVLWLLAVSRKNGQPLRLVAAFGIAVQLGAVALAAASAQLRNHTDWAMLGWAMLSLCIAALTYFLCIRRENDSVRTLLFWLCTVPPTAAAALCGSLYDGWLFLVHAGTCAALCWVIAAFRGGDRFSQRIFALWWAVILWAGAEATGDRVARVRSDWVVLGWAGISLLLAGLAFWLIHNKDITARRLLFWSAVFPPVIAAVFASFLYRGDLFYAHTGVCLVLCYLLLRTRWTEHPLRYVFAVLTPLIMLVIAAEAYSGRFTAVSDRVALLWTAVSLGTAVSVWLPGSCREDMPCRLLYALCALAPMSAACFAPMLFSGDLLYLNALLCCVLCYFFALTFDRQTPLEFSFAALLPLMLFLTANFAAGGRLRGHSDAALLIWTGISFAVALTVYFTTRRRFHAVRQTLFALCSVPPLLAGFFGHWYVPGNLLWAAQLLCAAYAVLLWLMFASRGFKRVSTGAFACSVLLICNTAGDVAAQKVFDGHFNYPAGMLGGLWIMLMSVAAAFIARKLFRFVGADAIPRVMQVITPCSAMFFAVWLLRLNAAVWQPLFFLYALAFCVLGWIVTKPTQIVFPAISMISLILSLEALRRHFMTTRNSTVAVVMFGFAVLTLLLPYLGIVEREDRADPAQKRRSYVLTAAGGFVPVWTYCVSWASGVTEAQHTWLRFFVPVLAAGWLLHFTFEQHDELLRRRIFTAAAVCCTVAFWLQPIYEVQTGSYWDGKLHLLPLIAFGVVIRRLYGAKIGGNFLFAIGVYAILRIAGAALMYERSADLVTILVLGLAIFIVSFFVKQKKWFLLGGATLVGIAVYLRMKLFIDIQWWVWLLLAGILLIVIAAANERLRARGDSLKERAGRLWEDWTW